LRSLHSTFVHVNLPQELAIRSPKLALLYRFLQLATLVCLGFYVWHLKVWTESTVPVPVGVSVWPEAPPPPPTPSPPPPRPFGAPPPIPSATTTAPPVAQHCAAPANYSFTYAGSAGDTVYAPTECRALEGSEGYQKEGNSLLIYTHVVNTEVLRSSSASECTAATEAACLAMNGTYAAVNASGVACTCDRRTEYLAENPDDMTIHFTHGFQARQFLMTRKRRVTTDTRDTMDDLVSVIQKLDGTPCQVNGRSEILLSDMGPKGIYGSLREWLACAGVDLDQPPSAIDSAADPAITSLRMMGAELHFHLHYSNVDGAYWPKVVCYITPVVELLWTSTYDHQRSFSVPFGASESTRTRHNFGVSVHVKVDGEVKYFSIGALITGIVNVLVIMTIPRLLIQLFIEHALGATSTMYKQAKCTHFDVNQQLSVAILRSLLPVMAFRGLVGGNFEDKADTLPDIPVGHLADHLKDCFARQFGDSELQNDDVKHMVEMVCKQAGKKAGEKVTSLSIREFQTIFNANELVGEECLAAQLHSSRTARYMEKLLSEKVDGDLELAEVDEDGEGSREVSRGRKGKDKGDGPGKKVVNAEQLIEEVTALKIEDRCTEAQEAAKKAVKGVEVVLGRIRAVEQKADLAELIAKSTSQHKSQAGADVQEVFVRLAALEELVQVVREEAQSAVYSLEAMRGEDASRGAARAEAAACEETGKRAQSSEEAGAESPDGQQPPATAVNATMPDKAALRVRLPSR